MGGSPLRVVNIYLRNYYGDSFPFPSDGLMLTEPIWRPTAHNCQREIHDGLDDDAGSEKNIYKHPFAHGTSVMRVNDVDHYTAALYEHTTLNNKCL